ncbi:MAG: ferredoxin, partial [Methanobacteriota archaeon]
ELEVFVPESSRITKHQILVKTEDVKVDVVDPGVEKLFLRLPTPSMEDNIGDLERLKRGLAEKGFGEVVVPLEVLRLLPQILRKKDWCVTATIMKDGSKAVITSLEPGDTSSKLFGVAIDIGTTTVVVNLVDLVRGRVVGTESDYNKQVVYGEDVLSRITHVEEKGQDGLEELNRLIVETINNLIKKLVENHLKDSSLVNSIVFGVASGNTTMTQLFLGIDPHYIRYEPYVPAAGLPPMVKASELGLATNPGGYIYLSPGRAAYVGGDITSDILASGIHKMEELSLLIDVGTNGEVVLGNNDWLVACSCSAGPAFEGGEVEHGMRAMLGAIDKIEIDESYEAKYHTIGDARPRGICGSGLIDLMAEMLVHGIIDRKGKIQKVDTNRIRVRNGVPEYVVAWATEASDEPEKMAGEKAGEKDIVITETDIANIIRTKAALYASANTLLKSLGLKFGDVDRIVLAGGFGNYIDVEKAVLIGMLPDVGFDRFRFIGNGSLLGATIALISEKKRRELEEIYKKITYVDLSKNNIFFNEFSSSLFLPHTNMEMFPTAKKMLEKRGNSLEV